MAIYVSNTGRSAGKGAPAKVTPATPAAPVATIRPKVSGNPATWPTLTVPDISVSGLGAYRAYRSHPGKSFPSSRATNYRDPADASDRALKREHGPKADGVCDSL